MTEQNDSNSSIANSPDPAADRRQQLAALIPEAFSEGQLDVAALKRALGGEAIIEGGERYALTWAGKGNAYKVLQTPSAATLRPQRELSVNFDEAQHVFIEGENLEVLKVLQKAYFGKVKLIYIDPPYNTGSDSFIYPDRFQESKEDYLRRINDLADDGTLMREGFFRKNNKDSGHYHSNWLSMMLPRLYIARNLLHEDGVIFVSCDDNEVHNLRLLMNEVFGEANFISQTSVVTNPRGRVMDKQFAKTHEYLLVYGRNELTWKLAYEKSMAQIEREYPEVEGRRRYRLQELRNTHRQFGKHNRRKMWYPVYVNPSNGVVSLSKQLGWEEVLPYWDDGYEGCWSCREWMIEGKENEFVGRLVRGKWKVYSKDYGLDEEGKPATQRPKSIWDSNEFFTDKGQDDVDELVGDGIFQSPKPVELIKFIVSLIPDREALVVDFFAGSGSLAHAVIEANALDSGSRRFIAVQLPEQCEEGSKAKQAGFSTIADVCRKRIQAVVALQGNRADLITQAPTKLGLKSYILTPSNFKQWRGDGIDTSEQLAEQMLMFAKSEKDGAEVEHILYELLLKFGQELTTSVEMLNVADGKVFAIHQRKMLFVLETFTEAMIQPMVDMKPREIIAIDGVFHDSDPLKSNLDLQCRDAGIKFTCL